MNLQEIQKRIASIKEDIDDHEMCHINEDALYVDFIEALSMGEIPEQYIQILAKEILKTKELDFNRWYA